MAWWTHNNFTNGIILRIYFTFLHQFQNETNNIVKNKKRRQKTRKILVKKRKMSVRKKSKNQEIIKKKEPEKGEKVYKDWVVTSFKCVQRIKLISSDVKMSMKSIKLSIDWIRMLYLLKHQQICSKRFSDDLNGRSIEKENSKQRRKICSSLRL